jgi:hypothetical protein
MTLKQDTIKPIFLKFGKYYINVKLLDSNILQLLSGLNYKNKVSWLNSRKITISDELAALLHYVIDTNQLDTQLQDKLDVGDSLLFDKIITKSNLSKKLNFKSQKFTQSKQERFDIIRGAFLAGNHSIDIKNELVSLLTYFYKQNKISKNEFDLLIKNLK